MPTDIRVPMSHVKREFGGYLGGQWWISWQAYTSFFRDVLGLELADDLWDRDRAYAQAQSEVGWWWPHRQFVVVSDRPRTLHLEQTGRFDYRMHCADGPAITWADGYAQYYWHGTAVPASLVTGNGWTVQEIIAEQNLEVRRCAIERMGWDAFIEAAGLRAVNTCPDPGNPGFALALYDLPEELNPYEEPVRMLLCVNATVERDGSRRRFGISVPADVPDALSAAAWTFDLPAPVYGQLEYAY